MPNGSDHPNLSARLPRFQFTLRSMLIFTSVVAVLCSFLFAMPDWAAGLVILFFLFLFPAILVTLVIHGNRDQRTFGIGALFPCAFLLFVALGFADFGIADMDMLLFPLKHGERLSLILFWALGALNGFLCVLTRRWIENRRETQEDGKPNAHATDLS